jgi:hypothetical protein
MFFFGKGKDTVELEKGIEKSLLSLDLNALLYAELICDTYRDKNLNSKDMHAILLILFISVYTKEISNLKDKKAVIKMTDYLLKMFVKNFKDYENNEDFKNFIKCSAFITETVAKIANSKQISCASYAMATQQLICIYFEDENFKYTQIYSDLVKDFILKSGVDILAAVLNYNGVKNI